MDELVWTTPSVDALAAFRSLPWKGSDTSWVNVYLLRRKYRLEIAVRDGVLFRYYHGKTPNRQGYGFPLSATEFDAGRIFRLLERDAEKRGGLRFCLCDERQKETVSAFFGFRWDSDRGDDDYVYERGKWIDFAGAKYHHLRNRANSFDRLYPGADYHPIDGPERLRDALRVGHTKWVPSECCTKSTSHRLDGNSTRSNTNHTIVSKQPWMSSSPPNRGSCQSGTNYRTDPSAPFTHDDFAISLRHP